MRDEPRILYWWYDLDPDLDGGGPISIWLYRIGGLFVHLIFGAMAAFFLGLMFVAVFVKAIDW